MKRIKHLLQNIFSRQCGYWIIYYFLLYTKLQKYLSDEQSIKLKYRCSLKRKLDLDNPRTFTEKLNWQKLYDRNPLYSKLVDKYEVKDYVAGLIGEEYLIKTLAVYDSADQIDFDSLPDKFVLKCTHDSGDIIICKDKNQLDVENARKKLNDGLHNNFYYDSREWPYKNVTPRIIAEEYMEDSKTRELRDYKFFCFDGEVKCMFVASDRQNREEPFFDFFDMDYNHLKIKNRHPNSTVLPEKPKCFELMKKLASVLSKGLPQVRIDLYEVDGRVYFGEYTFFHFGGFTPFEPDEWDYKLGAFINLPKQNC